MHSSMIMDSSCNVFKKLHVSNKLNHYSNKQMYLILYRNGTCLCSIGQLACCRTQWYNHTIRLYTRFSQLQNDMGLYCACIIVLQYILLCYYVHDPYNMACYICIIQLYYWIVVRDLNTAIVVYGGCKNNTI